jgi:hypothetical protein
MMRSMDLKSVLSSSCSVLNRLIASNGRSTRKVRNTLTTPMLESAGIMPVTEDMTHMKSTQFHESRRYESSFNTSPMATTVSAHSQTKKEEKM